MASGSVGEDHSVVADLAQDVDALWEDQTDVRRALTALDVMAGLALEGEDEACDGLPHQARVVRDHVLCHLEAQSWLFRKIYRYRVPGVSALAEHYLERHGLDRQWVERQLSDLALATASPEDLAQRARQLVHRARKHLETAALVWLALHPEERDPQERLLAAGRRGGPGGDPAAQGLQHLGAHAGHGHAA